MDTYRIENMKINPFEAELINGKIFGRGACDMKAALACFLTVAKAIHEAGVKLRGSLMIVGTCHEECRCLGVRHLVNENTKADRAIIGEPTQLKIAVAHKGASRVRIVTKARSAHSSTPNKGINAIVKMARIVSALEM